MNHSSIAYRKQTIVFISFLILWFVVNLLQSVFTEINADEAYYVLYGKHLDWGYFDHPPMVGLMTRISSMIFEGNLGVRFMTIVMQIGCLVITWFTLNKSQRTIETTYLFFIVSFASVMFSAYGFITTPDAPLLFFTALFLFGYKEYVESKNLTSSFILIIAATGLVYSKYQGLLVIVLVILSNLKLLKNTRFWLIAITTLILITPHLYWQYANEFPSIKYHVLARATAFKWGFVFEYLPNQLATFNPFVIGAAVFVMYRYKAAEPFEKALYYIIIGFTAFFGVTTIRGHVEPHWTVAATIPMILILVNKSTTDTKLATYIKKYIGLSIILLLIARIIICTTLLPERIQFHSKQKKYLATQEIAGNRPVIYSGSFQNPSLYPFFTGKNSTVISSLMSRITQFDLWKFQQQFQTKKVFIAMHVDGKSNTYTSKSGMKIEGFYVDSLQTTDHIRFNFDVKNILFSKAKTVEMELSITNSSNHEFIMDHRELPARIEVVWINKKDIICTQCIITRPFASIKAHQSIKTAIQFVVPDVNLENYKLGVSLSSIFGPSMNSEFVTIETK
jgi:hypothetical protein